MLFDKDQLIRIVTNLVKNAIQATENKKKPKIVVSLTQVDGVVELSVSDNGVGIPQEDKEKIFEPKFTTKTSGSGLGLAMVRSIVSSYNGNISLISEPTKGSTFVVRFNA